MAVDYLLDRAKTDGKPLALCYVDLEKAFDAVTRDRFMSILASHYGLDVNIMETVRRMYLDVRGQAVGHDGMFEMIMGVKQGCPLSPTLFSLYFDRVSDYIRLALSFAPHPDASEDGVLWVSHLAVQLTLYADDLVLMAQGIPSLQSQITSLSHFCDENGLTISTDKTKAQLVNCVGQLWLGKTALKAVTAFWYLGAWLQSNCTWL